MVAGKENPQAETPRVHLRFVRNRNYMSPCRVFRWRILSTYLLVLCNWHWRHLIAVRPHGSGASAPLPRLRGREKVLVIGEVRIHQYRLLAALSILLGWLVSMVVLVVAGKNDSVLKGLLAREAFHLSEKLELHQFFRCRSY